MRHSEFPYKLFDPTEGSQTESEGCDGSSVAPSVLFIGAGETDTRILRFEALGSEDPVLLPISRRLRMELNLKELLGTSWSEGKY